MEEFDIASLDVAERCPKCDQPLYKTPSSRPRPRWQVSALFLFVVGILAGAGVLWLQFTVWTGGQKAGKIGMGVAVMMAICGVAFALPRVRDFKCRKCSWSGSISDGGGSPARDSCK